MVSTNGLTGKKIWLTTTEIQEPFDVNLSLIFNVVDLDTLFKAYTL